MTYIEITFYNCKLIPVLEATEKYLSTLWCGKVVLKLSCGLHVFIDAEAISIGIEELELLKALFQSNDFSIGAFHDKYNTEEVEEEEVEVEES